MKIGILTQPLTTNYGGILQNYALQSVLIREGHDVFTFDLGRYNIIDWFVLLSKVVIIKLLGKKVDWPLFPSKNKLVEKPLRAFVYKHINLVKPRTVRPRKSIVNKYGFDCMIVGSDQVWRPKYALHIDDMFFSFCNDDHVLKLAYAASFGTEDWEFNAQQTKCCRELAQRFAAISVREESAVNLCKCNLSVEATHVLDPTLLLSSKDYKELCDTIPRKKPFVFAYILDEKEELIKEINDFSEQMKLPVFLKSAGKNISQDDSIDSWISNFRDAAYVITDSFHGTAFSINFNKDFQVLGNFERGNSRFDSLLSLFNLKDRMVNHINVEISPINWSRVNAILDKERVKSLNWLKENLNKKN